ncbi:MAG: glycosyltransferase family 4 protein [Solirubrobacteraceae bacterium]
MTRPLRIALVAGEDPGWGGIGTYTGELARGLAAEGHHVELVLRGWEADGVEVLDGLTVHRVGVPVPAWRRGTVALLSRVHAARESLVFSRRVARRLGRLGPLDVVEAPEFGAPGLAAMLRSRVARGPVVVVRLHAPGFLTARLAGEPPTVDARLVEGLERGAVAGARLVTSPSAALAAEVAARWGVPRRPVQIVANPIDAVRFRAGREPLEPLTLLVVGRIEHNKGQDVAVEALASIRRAVPGARLLLVGADSELAGVGGSALAALRRRAAALGLPDGALMATGAVDRSELPEHYAQAGVCLVPSRFEAFPYTCLEAMACGRPVVASRTGGLEEIISDGRDGLLVGPGDAASLAGAVLRLLGAPDLRRRLGSTARDTVERRFATPVIARRMAAVYNEAARPARMSPR